MSWPATSSPSRKPLGRGNAGWLLTPYRRAMRLAVAEHVLDVGGERRIGVNIFPDLARGDAKAHLQSEDIHQLLAGMPDKMGTENAVGRLIDDHLRPRHGFGIGFRGEPVEHVIGVNVDGKTLLPG